MQPQDLGFDELLDLFQNAPCGYLSASENGRILQVNHTFVDWTGHSRDQLIGRPFQELLNIAGRIYFDTHFAPLLRLQGFFNEVALDVVKADGSVLPVLVNAVERRDESGGLRFIRITIFNASDRRRYERELIEARKEAEHANAQLRNLNQTLHARVDNAIEKRLKAEDSLRQAQKMEAVGQLAGGIAHDFNNMLAVVLSGLNLLERRLAGRDVDADRYLAAARDGADRAIALTQRLLAVSRQQPLVPRPLRVREVLSGMIELLRGSLSSRIELETRTAEDLWLVEADASQLENAVLNLAVNARDAMPEGGRLTIETQNSRLDEEYAAEHAIEPGEYVMIAVTDTGSGMPRDVAARAFEPFFTTKEAGKGTGLGLSQVFGFVEQSGGHVRIFSKPGHGTTVRMFLPRLSETGGSPEAIDRSSDRRPKVSS